MKLMRTARKYRGTEKAKREVGQRDASNEKERDRRKTHLEATKEQRPANSIQRSRW